MRFSIATPALNTLPSLKRCVGSVRAQQGVDTQHLVQDACSTDGTAAWLQQQHDLDSASEPDDGMYEAINRAWARSSGDVLSWLNADEQYLPGTLEAVERTLAEHPDVDAVFGDYVICEAEDGRPLAARREIPLRKLYVQNGPLYAMSCTLFFRRRLLDRGSLVLDDSLKTMADAHMVLRLLEEGCRFMHLRQYLALFGSTGKNLSTTTRAKQEWQAWLSTHGIGGGRALQTLVRAARWIEKAAGGCYRRQPVTYDFCTNESGHSVRISEPRLTTRWRLNEDASG